MSKYTTGELAKLCNVSVRTVQYYDSRNILVPSELSEGGRRLYSEEIEKAAYEFDCVWSADYCFGMDWIGVWTGFWNLVAVFTIFDTWDSIWNLDIYILFQTSGIHLSRMPYCFQTEFQRSIFCKTHANTS